MEQQRILVITKDDQFASQVGETLREVGYRVWRARSDVEGMKKLNRASPCLVIMESELLPINKRYPLSHMRQASYVPIIAVGNDHDPAGMLEYGVDAYIVKPPNMRELTARVRTMLRRRNS